MTYARRILLGLCLCVLPAQSLFAADQPADSGSSIPFTEETLPNGLRVIYAPLHQAPVVHVRVLYHVGSKDERADRQGFAHMFEHMMFRGSAHVAPQEHMQSINETGGSSNAFTSFDETVYVNTVPAKQLEMALYLEADRMSSFKVSEDIYKTERKVVSEEWRIQQNKPYGNVFADFLKVAFTKHSYQWTPIGNMDHLLAAPVSELQDFFNTYYIPNNAVLVIAGDIDVDAAKKMVQKYYAWIPKGADIHRLAISEPEQTEARNATVYDRLAPLTDIMIGYHIPKYQSDDHYSLSVLSAILGEGSSSRLHKLLVSNDKPQCLSAGTMYEQLEDGGFFGVSGQVLNGKNPDDVKQALMAAVAKVVADGITSEELEKAKTLRRVEMIGGRETAEQIASQLGDEALYTNDPSRVNSDLTKLDAVTADDVKKVAAKYLQPQMSTALLVNPDPLGNKSRKATAAAAAISQNAGVAASAKPVEPREVHFPDGYPQHAPKSTEQSVAIFQKGEESNINGVKVIVMHDSRVPLVSWNLTMRFGSHSDPAGKEGLASMTAGILRRGAGKFNYEQLNEELESHGISLGVSDGGDVTTLGGSCTTEQLDRAFGLSRDVLMSPTFPEIEFKKMKEQSVNGLAVAQESPGTAADQDMTKLLWAGSPMGHPANVKSVSSITLDDVKKFYSDFYHPNDAILVISGDVTVARGQELAKQLTDGWAAKDLAKSEYNFPPVASNRHIILIDRPGGKGATIRMGIRAYDIHDDEKFAGSLASSILSAGIESRLNLYVRAQKGYVYGVQGTFQPGRHVGGFFGSTETKLETTADTIEAMFKVFNDIRTADVTPEELNRAKSRVAGGMVMGMQTIGAQATYRRDGILNGYPIDYFDVYPTKIAAVTPQQIRDVMNKYVNDNAMTIIVVAPADEVKEQLKRLGDVEVRPMPSKRPENATTKPTDIDLMKPAT